VSNYGPGEGVLKENNRYGWPDCDVSRPQHSNRGNTAETVVNPALFPSNRQHISDVK